MDVQCISIGNSLRKYCLCGYQLLVPIFETTAAHSIETFLVTNLRIQLKAVVGVSGIANLLCCVVYISSGKSIVRCYGVIFQCSKAHGSMLQYRLVTHDAEDRLPIITRHDKHILYMVRYCIAVQVVEAIKLRYRACGNAFKMKVTEGYSFHRYA